MTIRIGSNAPPGTHAAVGRFLAQNRSRGLFAGVNVANIGATDAYPVHVAGLADLVNGQLPHEPHHWRHLLVENDKPIAEADLVHEGVAQARVVAVHQGPRAAGTAAGLEQANALSTVYDLRLLEAPAIHLVALWLRQGNEDVLIAVDPDQSGLPRNTPVSLEAALPLLRERAAAIQKAQDENPGPSGN